MQHLGVLINLISLLLGVIAGSILISRYLNYPSVLLTAFLKFFFSYSYLIIIAAVFSYLVINVSSVPWLKTLFACLIFTGMSLIIFTLPEYTFKERGHEITGWFKKSILISGIITGLQVPVLWFAADRVGVVLPIVIAFLPFIFVVLTTLNYKNKFRKHSFKTKKNISFYIYTLLAFLGVIETYIGTVFYYRGNFIILSLPLAYSYSAIQIIREYSIKQEALEQSIDKKIIVKFHLTSREIEIAEKILAGSTNKEIAFDLDLSQNTVRNHIYNLYRKLGIQKRMDLLKLTKQI